MKIVVNRFSYNLYEMTLRVYRAYPFVTQNAVSPVDFFTGNGVSNTFNLIYNTAATVGQTIAVDLVNYSSYNQGFYTTSGSNTITISSVPAINAQIVVPGIQALNFTAYDQVSISGAPSPANVQSVPFWVADDGAGTNNIFHNTYPGVPSGSGISIQFQNLDTRTGAQTFWMQLACADANGNALSYGATAAPIYTTGFFALSTLTASASALTNTLSIAQAANFTPGDYIWINPGGGTYENVRITSIDYTRQILTTTGQTYAHNPGEQVYQNGRKFFAQMTIPINALGGAARNLVNLALVVTTAVQAR